MHRRTFIATACCALCTGPARAGSLIEPHMHFAPAGGNLAVAVTLDACMGETDERILGALIDNGIAATIFATRRWLEKNPAAIKVLRAHPDLFSIENHGAQHVPAVIGTEKPYGLAPAGTASAVFTEVMGGSQAVTTAFGAAPKWYRDASALYTRDAMDLIGTMGFRIAGFSLNGDIGASVSAEVAATRIGAARSGDVIISHINQPKRPAGAGVVAGLLALKAKGFRFVHLDDVEMVSA